MKKKIMIIEDDAGVQDVFRLLLEKAGYETIILTDGNAIIQNNFEHPDLILLDRQLSGIDGLDICTYLKNKVETRHIPVIMTSATTNVGRLARLAKADDFIEKPFRSRELMDMIRNHLP
jgi:CheY-like chemotaxis protein